MQKSDPRYFSKYGSPTNPEIPRTGIKSFSREMWDIDKNTSYIYLPRISEGLACFLRCLHNLGDPHSGIPSGGQASVFAFQRFLQPHFNFSRTEKGNSATSKLMSPTQKHEKPKSSSPRPNPSLFRRIFK